MDLLRSTIKSLLFDFPPEEVLSYLCHTPRADGRDSESTAKFYEIVKELTSWREIDFTSSEIGLLNDVLKREWLVDEEFGFSVEQLYTPLERIFLIFEKCARELLDTSTLEPRVKFEHLLRWRELTLLTGEDNMILPLLAKNDIANNRNRTCFLWPNTLDHNNVRLNSILDSTLSDTHFHLNAGCDVFEFNWLIAMNNPAVLDRTDVGFLQDGSRRNYDRIKRHYGVDLSLQDWIRLACYLRMALFDALTRNDFTILSAIEFDGLFEGRGVKEITEGLIPQIERLCSDALKTSNGIVFDYAITAETIRELNPDRISDVYMVHHGERWIIYTFLKFYFGNHEQWRRVTPIVYLYLLIKNKMRRELIQNNELRGFENFQIYQSYKHVFFRSDTRARAMRETAFRYAVQSALGKGAPHYLEARVSPREVSTYQNLDFCTSIFGDTQIISEEDKTKVTLVAHFLKKKDDEPLRDARSLRHGKFRRELQKDLRKLDIGKLIASGQSVPAFVGIDAASNELGCRPEIFAPVFNKARTLGVANITYHVGEDFYDITDGLRAIDEALEFLNMNSGSRIGHAIAMGIDVKEYYKKRHQYIIIPKQELLDNVVWLKYKAMVLNIALNPATLFFIKQHFTELSEYLGYGRFISDGHYWESMRRRAEDPLDDTTPVTEDSDIATRLLDIYWRNTATRRKGYEVTAVKVPQSYVEDVEKLSDGILRMTESRGVFIETNPTSNMRIGGFGKYIDLPLFKFHSIGDTGWKLPVTINTDDKGVFATSLRNEYSLIAVALWKACHNNGERIWKDSEITDYLKRIAEYSNVSRFRSR